MKMGMHPTWPSETRPARVIRIDPLENLTVPVFITLRSGMGAISGGTLMAGGATFVEAGPRGYRARLVPGDHTLELAHPSFKLPADQQALRVDRSPMNATRLVVADSGPVEPLAIRGWSFALVVGETADYMVTHSSGAIWSSAMPDTLRTENPPGRFRALKPGIVEIRVRAGGQEARSLVAIRASHEDSAMRPVDPRYVATDPTSGVKFCTDRLLIKFRANVGEEARRKALRELGLSIIGVAGSLRLYQVAVAGGPAGLAEWIRRVQARPEAEVVSRETLVRIQAAGIGPYVPKKLDHLPAFQRKVRFWNQLKIGAYPAFGVLRSRQVPEADVLVLDHGLAVDSAGMLDGNFAKNVALDRSAAVENGVVYTVDTVGEAGLKSRIKDIHAESHGNRISSLTVSELDPPPDGIPGIYPWGKLRAYRALPLTDIVIAMEHAARVTTSRVRVMNVSRGNHFGASNQGSTDAENKQIADPIDLLVNTGWLIVLAAGNDGDSVRHCSFASVGSVYTVPPNAPGDILVVGGTEVALGDTLSDPEGPEVKWKGSNYDPVGTTPLIEIAAPAERIWSSRGDGYNWASGTSEAAPQVAAVAALVWALLPHKTAKQIKQLLLTTAHRMTPVEPSEYPKRHLRLQFSKSQLIGGKRLNMWEAVLRALQEASGQRYFGMRITCSINDLEVRLLFQGIPAHPPLVLPDLTRQNRDDGNTELTYTFCDTDPLPDWIETYDPRTNKCVHSLHLTFSEGERRVRWYRLWLGGSLTVDWIGEDRGFGVRITNSARPPEDPDFLDPDSREPGDPDYRPWQKLANGDSFALIGELLESAPGAAVQWLDANGKPLPSSQVDDLGHPYVTIPFGVTSTVSARLVGPASLIGRRIRVSLAVRSLNNEIVSSNRDVLLEIDGGPLFDVRLSSKQLVNGPNWPLWADLEITYRGGARRYLKLEHVADPPEWTLSVDQPGWFDPGQTGRIPDFVQRRRR